LDYPWFILLKIGHCYVVDEGRDLHCLSLLHQEYLAQWTAKVAAAEKDYGIVLERMEHSNAADTQQAAAPTASAPTSSKSGQFGVIIS